MIHTWFRYILIYSICYFACNVKSNEDPLKDLTKKDDQSSSDIDILDGTVSTEEDITVNKRTENDKSSNFYTDVIEDKFLKKENTLDSNDDEKRNSYFDSGIELHLKAVAILNSARGDKQEAYSYLQEASNLGNTDAMLMLAWAKLFGGDSIQQDTEGANNLFEKLSNLGIADAQVALGFMNAVGLFYNSSQPKAILLYTFAAIGGSSWARMALGYRYYAGLSVTPNCEKALEYYSNVARKVANEVRLSGGTIVTKLRLMDELDNPGYSSGNIDTDLIEYYELIAEKGDINAQVKLGQLYFQGGRGIAQDSAKAYSYFRKAAEAGNTGAMAYLGKMYMEGNGVVKPDYDIAVMFFRRSAEQGNPIGQSGLGLMYMHGKGVDRDYEKALEYFTKAAEQGWVDGQLQLGIMLFRGLGVRRNYKEALKYFSLASQTGHILAIYNLAQMHATGTGVIRSCATSVKLFKNVAERGRWSEKLMEAFNYYKEGRYNEAYMLYALLSELGYEVAQSNAAYMLDRGDVSLEKIYGQDQYKTAYYFWTRAAFQGYSPAIVKMGDYHYYGLSTDVDYELAALHYGLAYEQQQNAQALFNLAYMHEKGLGVSQDLNLARRFYDEASEIHTDAVIPVTLAIMKLSVIVFFKSVKEFNWLNFAAATASAYNFLGPDWDVYVVTLLIATLMFSLYFRQRPFRN